MVGLKEILKITKDGSLLNTWHFNAVSTIEAFLSQLNIQVPFENHFDYIHCVRFSPDGNRIAAINSRCIKLWSIEESSSITLEGHNCF